jgi:PAS domain S-box-containing protein
MASRISDNRYSLFFRRAIEGIHILDVEGNVIEVNQSFCDLLGYSPVELAQMNVEDWDVQWNGAELKRKINQLRDKREVFETRHRKKSGEVIDVKIAVVALDVDGQMMLYCSAHDITARKQAESALCEAENRFRCVVEQSIAGAFIMQGGRFVYANPRFAEIFGFPNVESVIGTGIDALVAPENQRLVEAYLSREFLRERSKGRIDFNAVRQDGRVIHVGIEGSPSEYLGQPATVGLLQDISERFEAERQRVRYIHDLQLAVEGTINIASRIGELRDAYTASHERRVAALAVTIGKDLGLPESQIKGLGIAGLLHDIGKVAVPAEILSKPSRLNAAEYSLVQMHAQQGYDVLAPVSFPWPLADTVLQHHERLDGSGYPNGLAGNAILLEARILAVADTVEAMAAHRPYRPALGLEKAIEELEHHSGVKYDIQVAGSCVNLIKKKASGLESLTE